MDVFTEAVQKILEDMTSAVVNDNPDKSYNDKMKETPQYFMPMYLGAKSAKKQRKSSSKVSKKSGKQPETIKFQRRTMQVW